MFKLTMAFIFLITVLPTVWAVDDFVAETEGGGSGGTETVTDSPIFTLDSGNLGGDITLEFGTALGEYLQWDLLNSRFSLSDSLSLGGHEIVDTRLENQAAAPTCDGATIGKIYYNTTDSLTYVCDGTNFNPLENVLGSTVQFPAVQARRTTTYTLTTGFVDIDLDTTDLENDATTLDHDDTLRDRVNINETGLYQIIYSFTPGSTATGAHEATGQVRVNDTTVLNGSTSVNKNYQVEYSTTSASFITALTSGDFVSLQLMRDAVADSTQGDIFFSIVKLEGIKGDTGATGPAGGTTAVVDVYDGVGGTAITQTEAVLNLDTTRVIDADFSLSTDEITMNTSGLYRITGRLAALSLNISGTARANIVLNFQTDTGGGFTDVSGTACRDYMREQNAGIVSASCSVAWIESFAVGDKLRLTHQMTGTTTGQTLTGGSGVLVEFVR